MVQKEARARGRPRSFDPDEVLDKARAVFWNRGYAATSLDDLALATGLNRPSLYAAFGDKHALYMAALERSRAEATAALGAALATEMPLRQILGMVFDRTVDIYRAGDEGQRGCFLVGTATTLAVEDSAARELLAAYVAQTDRLFRERFERSTGELVAGVTPEVAAPLASGTFHTLAVRARTGASEAELKAIGRAAVTLICGAG
ncbi:TetR/AcrR family transcriptional regulator [Phenylobacterium sp.]|uniref:TetR/AcrR family transcriptional regulator n=1 Tax=Phenylobacterium sp. TaxID=1871053 RepID=UPI0025E08C61|nr:TetR/AcrR family transcriptional regulator [Phenylobacterium sp.]